MSSGSRAGAFTGCFVLLGLYVVLALVVTIVTALRLPEFEPEDRIAVATITGAGSGLFLLFAATSAWEIARRVREIRRLRACERGLPFRDGDRIAACGTLVADGPLLTAPLSGKPSVIYKYEIAVPQKKSSDFVACSGYALAPCRIETPSGCVRLLAYTEPTFAAAVLDGPEMRARAHAYFASTEVTPLGVGAAAEFLDTLVDDDGAIRSDTGAMLDVVGNQRLSFSEHAVADRERVCAFGRYSAGRGGLVPDPGSTDPVPVRLRRGDGAAVRRSLLWSAFGYAVAALLMVAIAYGISWVARAMYA